MIAKIMQEDADMLEALKLYEGSSQEHHVEGGYDDNNQ